MEILGHIMDGVNLVRASDLTILYANPRLEAMFGYAPGELIGRHVSVLNAATERDPAAVADDVLASLAESGTWEGDVLNRRKDGTTFWCSGSVRRWSDPALGDVYVSVQRDVTERRRLEEAERQARVRLDRTFAALSSAVFVVDARTRVIIDCNPAVQAVFGYRPEEVLGRNTEFLHVSRRAYRRFGREMYRALDASGVFHTLFELRRRDGGVIVSDHTVTEIRDERGERVGLVSVVRDVTERHRAETEREAHRKLLLSAGAARDLDAVLRDCLATAIRISDMDCGGIYLVDGEGGLRLGQAIGLSRGFVSAAGAYRAGAANTLLVKRGAPVYGRYREMGLSLSRDESREGLRALAVLPFRSQGKVIGSLNLASHVTSEVPQRSRVSMESLASLVGLVVARAQSEAELRESEERYRSVVQGSMDGVMLTAPDGRIFSANRAACRMLGRSEQELIRLGRDCVHAASDPQVTRALERRARQGRFFGELRFRRADGTTFPGEVSSVVFSDKRGELRTSIVLRDISERVAARQELRRQEEALARAERVTRLGVVASAFAHELNQPLTGVLANAQVARRLLGDRVPDLAEIRGALGEIVDDARRAAGFLASLRRMLRRGTPIRRRADMNRIVLDAIRLYRGDRMGGGLPVRTRLGRALPRVLVDPVQMQQVVLNLLVNAGQAAGGGAPEGAGITVSTALHPGRGVVVAVADRGVGIPVGKQERVFEAFYTTKRDGIGLGLPICRSLVEANGGSIWAARRRGGGARVSFVVPADGGGER